MPRLLVVVDGSTEAAEALARAMDVAAATQGSEIILLGIAPDPPAWEVMRARPKRAALREVLRRARSAAAERGLHTRARLEQGEKGDVVTHVARLEDCDQIFVTEPRSTLVTRAVLAITAACTGRVAGRIINSTGVPVTVIAPKAGR